MCNLAGDFALTINLKLRGSDLLVMDHGEYLRTRAYVDSPRRMVACLCVSEFVKEMADKATANFVQQFQALTQGAAVLLPVACTCNACALDAGGKSDPYYKIRQAFGPGYQSPDVNAGYNGKHKCKALYKSEVVPRNLDPVWKTRLLDLNRCTRCCVCVCCGAYFIVRSFQRLRQLQGRFLLHNILT